MPRGSLIGCRSPSQPLEFPGISDNQACPAWLSPQAGDLEAGSWPGRLAISSGSGCTSGVCVAMFGFPGDGINGLLGGLARFGTDRIQFIQVRREEMAAFMAITR